MSELFNNLPSLNDLLPAAVTQIGNNAATSAGFSSVTLVYILLGGLLVFVLGLMLMNKPIDFSWLDPRPKSMVVTSDAYLFWKPSRQFTNLRIPAGSVPGFESSLYSISFDAVLKNTRSYRFPVMAPWRQIMHRGSDELAVTSLKGALLAGGCTSSTSNNAGLPPYGLPRRMNPGIFLDPNKNDIVVFVDTTSGAESYRESVRLVDIPMDIPFRMEVIVHNRLLEVYLNCRLEVSKVLSGTPLSVEDVWYGLAGSAAADAQIQNLYVWKRVLPADQIGSLCSGGPPKFTFDRPICDAAESEAIPDVAADAPPSVAYGNALSSCRTS